MTQAYYFYVQKLKKQSAVLMALASVFSFATIMMPRTAAAAATSELAYVANGVAYYKLVGDTQWSVIDTSNSQEGVMTASIGANGCVVYRTDTSNFYYKPSPTSTTDTLIVDGTAINLALFAIDSNCGFVWSQFDDVNTYATSVWYKSSPGATAVEYAHNSYVWLGGLGITDTGGVAWIDAESTLWYRSSPTASIEQVSPLNDAVTFDINGAGNIAWQDSANIVWYKTSPSDTTADQISEEGVAAYDTVTLSETGGVAFTCNTQSIYYRAPNASTTSKLTIDNFTSRGVVTADGEGFFYESYQGAMSYVPFNTMTAETLTGDYTSPQSLDAY